MPLDLNPVFYLMARDSGLPGGFRSCIRVCFPCEPRCSLWLLWKSSPQRGTGVHWGNPKRRLSPALPQLLKEQTNRLNPAMEIWNVKLLVRSMQVVVGKPKAHHDRWNLQHVLEIGHDRNRPAGANKHGLFLERVMKSPRRGLHEPVVGANHACRALAPSLDLDVDSLGRMFLDDRRVTLEDVIRILVRHQPHGNFCRCLRRNHRLPPRSHNPP